MKWETACRFSTCVVRSFLYLDTDQTLSTSSFASLRVTFFAYFKSVIKISKGFRKWNCFRKTGGLNTSWFLWATRNCFWPSDAKSHSFFSLVVMFDLTSSWVRDNSISLSEHRNLVNIRITNYSLSCLQPALWRTLSVCRVLHWWRRRRRQRERQ